MVINLNHTIPTPLADWDTGSSQVWGAQLQLNQGEIVQVQAASGKGKSTLVQIIYGNRKDYAGTVTINGNNIAQLTHRQWAELRQHHLSIMFQDLRLFADLTGWENILLKLRLTHYYEKPKVEEMAQRLGVASLLNKKCGIMSYGERQRTAIVRALVQPFDWILLDEPFSHLDKGNTAKAAALIREEADKRGAGILVACLDMDHDLTYNRTIQL